MLAVIIILLIVIAGLFIWKSQLKTQTANNIQPVPKTSIEAGQQKTQELINEVKQSAQEASSISQVVSVNRIVDGQVVKEEAVMVAPNTSPISTKTGDVISQVGQEAKNNVQSGLGTAPASSPKIDPSKLPSSSVKLIMSTSGFSPAEFTVNPGQAISLAITNNTPWGEIVKFSDSSLSAIGLSLLIGDTGTITFNAPLKVGEYVFSADLAKVQGKMIIK